MEIFIVEFGVYHLPPPWRWCFVFDERRIGVHTEVRRDSRYVELFGTFTFHGERYCGLVIPRWGTPQHHPRKVGTWLIEKTAERRLRQITSQAINAEAESFQHFEEWTRKAVLDRNMSVREARDGLRDSRGI